MAIVAQAKGVYATGTTSFIADVPAGIQANDILLIVCESTDSTTTAGTPNTPAGWTKLFEETQGAGATGVTTLTIFAKVATGSETDVTVDGVGNHISGNMFAIRGAKASLAAADLKVGTGTGANTGNMSAVPGITVDVAGCLGLLVCCSTRDAITSANWSAWASVNGTNETEWEDNCTNTGAGGGIGVAWYDAPASGSTGDGSATIGVSVQWRAVQLIFEPAEASLDAQPGSYAVSGAAASPVAGRAVDATPGSYSLSGVAAGVVSGRSLEAVPGSYAVAGVVAGLLAERTLAALLGSYAVAGSDAGLGRAFAVNAEPGTYLLDGLAAGVLSGRSLEAVPGAYSLTGAGAGLLADRSLEAVPGAYSVDGFGATLIAGRSLEAVPGAYVLTGLEADLEADRSLEAVPGAYAVAGAEAAIVVDRVLEASPGVYLLVGFDADLVHTIIGAYVLNAETGTYTLTGLDAGVVVGRVIGVDAGAYAVAGFDVGLHRDLVVVASPADYVVTGLAANLVLLTGTVTEFPTGRAPVLSGRGDPIIASAGIGRILSPDDPRLEVP